jgi:hypothetical protein
MKRSWIVVPMLVLGGCATPPAALDEANNTGALTMVLQSELSRFAELQQTIASQRLASIRRLNELMLSDEADSRFEQHARVAAGMKDEAQLLAQLTKLADSRAEDDRTLQAQLAALDKMLSELLVPLPSQSAQLQATQQALAVLGQELSPQERARLVVDFVKDVKKTVDENKAKADEAQRAAAGVAH